MYGEFVEMKLLKKKGAVNSCGWAITRQNMVGKAEIGGENRKTNRFIRKQWYKRL